MTVDVNVMAKKRVDISKLVNNEELKMIIRKLVIYKDNKRCIEYTKSFEKPAQSKYN